MTGDARPAIETSVDVLDWRLQGRRESPFLKAGEHRLSDYLHRSRRLVRRAG